MARRQPSEIELCFDSMTDLITNLAGGLILVVLLLLGMTQPASSKDDRLPPPRPVDAKVESGEKPLHPLEVQVQQLRSDIEFMDKNIKSLEAKLPGLEKEVEDLIARAQKGGKSPPVPDKGKK